MFTVFPNPSYGIFNISHNLISFKTPYQIVDSSGKIIQLGVLNAKLTEIDLSMAQKGVYLLHASGTLLKLVKM